jgi:hypothetical protein
MLDDVDMLRLLESLETIEGNDIGRVLAILATSNDAQSDALKLQDLIDAGWVRTIYRRVYTTLPLMKAAQAGPLNNDAAFSSWLDSRYETSFVFPPALSEDERLAGMIEKIRNAEITPRDIGCRSPEWVAARLWERLLQAAPDGVTALRRWIDRWTDLGHPRLIPSRVWDSATVEAFHNAALTVFETESGLVGWDQIRMQIAKEANLSQQTGLPPDETFVPPVPQTFLERVLWLRTRVNQHALMTHFEFAGDLVGLMGLIFDDIEAAENAGSPHNLFRRLIEIAVKRPELVFLVDLRVQRSPLLLADMLLLGTTSAAACLTISQWEARGGAWDREATRSDEEAAKLTAFDDAISVTCYLLQQAEVATAEVGALLTWLHLRGRTNNLGDSGTMLRNLRGALGQQQPGILSSMADGLAGSIPSSGLGSAEFAAAMDVIHAGRLEEQIDPEPLLSAYVQSVAEGKYTLSAHCIAPASAASLIRLVLHAGTTSQQQFFYPIDLPSRVAAQYAPEANRFSVAEEVARSLRAHIRVLCRAAIGQPDEVPAVLADALISAVRSGAIARADKAQVDAFSAQFETAIVQKPLDRPISVDLGGALSALASDRRADLLEAILEIEEPLVLAQLLDFVPRALHQRIEARIAALPPSKAGDIYMLTALQARINELLNAGAADAAAQFLELERNATTIGRVPGRELTRLNNVLRLLYLRHEWPEIDAMQLPEEIPQWDRSSAEETLRFFRAVASLHKPGGDPKMAAGVFAELRRKHPERAAYSVNLYAAQIAELLGENLFVVLSGNEAVRADQVLKEIEKCFQDGRLLGEADARSLRLNRALLLLALGRPHQAINSLAGIRTERQGETVAALRAVALFRSGLIPEAIAVLDVAEADYGKGRALDAARSHILTLAPFAGSVSVVTGDDPLPRIKTALLELLQLDPIRQASALNPEAASWEGFLIGHVRSAAASVVSLVPMMKSIELDSSEDDVTAILREILQARLNIVGWAVSDQSKGGYTARGGPGERDLIVRKDNTTLTVIEAVVCKLPAHYKWTKGELTSHFQKLFAYEICQAYFHLTYAHIRDQNSILDYLKQMVQKSAPPGFTFVDNEELPLTDSRPRGFVASFDENAGRRRVVFLVLDLAQDGQKEAAKKSATSDPRN